MAIPVEDLDRIRLWCRQRVPERLWDKVRVEADEAPRHVTIVETRPAWDGRGDWTRFPVARLRYTMSRGSWTLYWRDRDLKFHSYPAPATAHVQVLLDVVNDDETGIFFG